GNAGAGMDAARVLVGREEERQHARDGNPGIRDADERFGGGGEVAGNDDGGGGALFGGGEVGFLFGEGEVTGTGEVGGGEAGQFDGAVAADFGAELFGDLRN